jgi:hypothetical protein
MGSNNKPSIKITLSSSYFNALFTMFAYYKASEKHHGETYQSHYCRTLESKIRRYGRIIKSEDGESVLLYFFENEAAQLMNIFVNYITEYNEDDYFSAFRIEKNKGRNTANNET